MTEERDGKGSGAREFLYRGSKLAAGVLILLPPVLGYLYVYLFGVNVVYGDEWRIVTLFEKLASGELKAAHLWAQLNAHRIFVPRVLILLLGTFTKWNTVAEMYVTQTLLLVTLLVLFVAFDGSIRSRHRLLLFAPVSFLVFSLRQAEVMLLGLLVQFALVLAFAVLAFYFLQALRGENPWSKLAFPAALASATLATLSSAQGLLVWPVGFVQLLIGEPRRRTKWLLVGTWGFLGVAEWVVYFVGYHVPAHSAPHPSYNLVAGPLYFPRFFFTEMGSALSWWQEPAFVIGLLLLVLVGAGTFLVVREGRLTEYSFWLSLLLFSFLVLLAVTVGLAQRGIDQALVSRYTLYSILGVVGLYATLAKLSLEIRSRLTALLFGTLLFVIAVCTPLAYEVGIKAGIFTEATMERAASILATYESQPDSQLTSLNPNPQLVRKRAPILQQLGYNVFSETGP
jgi:hypothetical protein